MVTLGSYKLYFADPQAGQVGFFGTIEEHGHPVILGRRHRASGESAFRSAVFVLSDRSAGDTGALGHVYRLAIQEMI